MLDASARRSFDLATDRPFRAQLFSLAPDEHVLLMVVHHIAADGWSMGVLGRDLARAYEARCRGVAPGWAPLAVQYADYTLWQQELLGDEADPGSVMAGQLAYWTAALADLPEQLELPTDRSRPAVASHRGDTVRFQIDPRLHQGLIELAAANRVSLFMVLQAALAALLTRLGAGADIPIGSPIAGRTDDALDDLVGFFVNTLVLRTDTSGDPSFAELLARVREADLAAYAHQDLPFERLVEVLNPARSLSRHPLFQVMLVLQNTPRAGTVLDLPGLVTRREPVAIATAKFDLSLQPHRAPCQRRHPRRHRRVVEYSTDLFDRASVEAMVARLVRLCEAAVADPHQPIGRIEILSQRGAPPAPVDYNDTARRRRARRPCRSCSRPRCGARPDNTALVFEDTAFTYAQLNSPSQPAGPTADRQGGGTRDIRRLGGAAVGGDGRGGAGGPQGRGRLRAHRGYYPTDASASCSTMSRRSWWLPWSMLGSRLQQRRLCRWYWTNPKCGSGLNGVPPRIYRMPTAGPSCRQRIRPM